ncbi:flagellar biosynthetic protein FliR [Massilia sp. YIM B02769]|jgi:flagellar biosynthesis protein FliR|uniref:flagellar biosynthetic protein FliR n=1 Tax=unclassified Massilia TaxID=2609279 RepID=UPI0025B69920|nr:MULTISPECIES: flagellar biosynthetic protein FliR [unclassified Massilia]MDN4057338.1 flagellar biosynthetic protein FliR [Massilia sp. YIM B02769]
MLTLVSSDINAWIAGLLWPLTRILGLVASAPLFGHASVPVSVKVVLGVLLALVIAPTVPAVPALDPMSYAGLLILVQELLIGLAMGFSMRLVFAAVEYAGELASSTMGFGFASFFDPSTQGRSAAISQFLSMVATMAFLAVNAHLVLLAALAESFVSLPISATPLSLAAPLELVRWGSRIFSAGLQLALPILGAVLIVNVALGILTRAAPQLNIFGIGFPITLGVGLLTLSIALPYLGTPIVNLFNEGIEAGRRIPRVASERVPASVPPAPGPAPAAPVQD